MADWSLPFIAFSVLILGIIGILFLIAGKQGTKQQLSHLSLIGMVFIILGIAMGSDRLIGYAFLGAGVLVAVFDAVKNRQKK